MSRSSGVSSFLGGVAIGGGLVYLLDPDRGNRRRAAVRDKAARAVHGLGDAMDKAIRDLQNRARGALAETWSAVRHEQVPDGILVERIHTRLGRVVSHPSAIGVRANNGHVILEGPVLESELDRLISAVWSVRGVQGVDNRLEVHKEAAAVPALQRGSGRPGSRPDIFQENWAPGTRLLAEVAGAALIGIASRRRILGVPLGLVGGGLLLRSIVNRPVRSVLGLGGGRPTIRLQKTYEFNAPVEEVYNLWSNPEQFPRFMSRVKDVRRTGDDHYHWTVAGPAGIGVSWDAIITEQVPNQVIAWSSMPGSVVRTAGIVRFQSADGGSRAHVLISYTPPAGAIGHAIAALFGADPRHALEEDMVRFKSLLERGKTTGREETISRDQIA